MKASGFVVISFNRFNGFSGFDEVIGEEAEEKKNKHWHLLLLPLIQSTSSNSFLKKIGKLSTIVLFMVVLWCFKVDTTYIRFFDPLKFSRILHEFT